MSRFSHTEPRQKLAVAPTAKTRRRKERDEGIAFPTAEDGRRSSIQFGRGIFAAAAGNVRRDLADAIRAESDWRRRYPVHVRALVEASLTDPVALYRSALAGLSTIHDRLEYHARGWRSLRAAVAADDAPPIEMTVLRGQGDRRIRLEVPYRGKILTGDALRRQLDHWVSANIVEPGFADAMHEVIDHPEWLDLSDWKIALLGAGAELGPYQSLARWRARLYLVDVPRPEIWRRLLKIAQNGNCEVHLPVTLARVSRKGDFADRAGVDLLSDAPAIANWLAAIKGPLLVGCHAYQDGEAHLRVAAAMDAIVERLMAQSGLVIPAFLLTPTDMHVVPAAAITAQRAAWAHRGMLRAIQSPLHLLSGRRLFSPSFHEPPPGPLPHAGIVDGLIIQQGPNYALAKRLQHWRAITSIAAGRRVSAHVAPATRTRSVVKNRLLKAAYTGAGVFGVEVFEPECANALMAALLVRDLRHPTPPRDLQSALFAAETAAHGGLWRIPYAPRSVLPIAALLGLMGITG